MPALSHARETDASTPRLRFASALQWPAIARAFPQYSLQQSPAYSLELARRRGALCEFVYLTDVQDPDHIVAAASVRVRSLPVRGAGLAYISNGPLLSWGIGDPQSLTTLDAFLVAAVGEYVDRRQLSLRMALPTVPSGMARSVADVFLSHGFGIAASRKPYRTLLVDLARAEDEIRAGLGHKWRNQLNASLRQPPAVEFTSGPGALARFSPLLAETSQRKGFRPELDASFFDSVQQVAGAEERMLVATAVKNEQDVAGVVASILGDTAVYVLGATTVEGMKSKASYALHWQVMLTARERGCRWYDLGGIDHENNPGVHHFKAGFGGAEVVAPGPFERRPTGVAGLISRIVDESYTRVKRWRQL
jgi:hypothetical protein